jgi:hypothetical protein
MQPLDRCAPLSREATGDIVEDFVVDVVGDDVEEVLAINESARRTSNQIKVRRSILVDSVFGH